MSFDQSVLLIAVLLGFSVIASKFATKLGIPVLLVFIGIGMVAGSEGLGGIEFTDNRLAQHLGVLALSFILFSGGMDTDWRTARRYIAPAGVLATIGVLATAVAVGLVAQGALGFSLIEGLLLGSIVACTDSAAVFGQVRGAGIRLGNRIQSIVELESGFNDTTAVALTILFTGVLSSKEELSWLVIPKVILELLIGIGWGIICAKVGVIVMKKVRLEFQAMYQVISIALALAAYSGAAVLHGNGFMAVYLAGLLFGAAEFHQRKGLGKFHDGLAWLMQIAMFLVLGLLVFPSKLVDISILGLLIAIVAMFVARPIGVAISLTPFRIDWRTQAMVSWCGLRGAAPIVLATFPLLAQMPKAQTLFDVVFFMVLFSALVQGLSLPWVARMLGLKGDDPAEPTGTTA
ncbi:MAG: potassium/proton antiporter [Chthonomonas sp.]|nr:potassium/proton antiporter [Chthonomonas sp.]